MNYVFVELLFANMITDNRRVFIPPAVRTTWAAVVTSCETEINAGRALIRSIRIWLDRENWTTMSLVNSLFLVQVDSMMDVRIGCSFSADGSGFYLWTSSIRRSGVRAVAILIHFQWSSGPRNPCRREQRIQAIGWREKRWWITSSCEPSKPSVFRPGEMIRRVGLPLAGRWIGVEEVRLKSNFSSSGKRNVIVGRWLDESGHLASYTDWRSSERGVRKSNCSGS